MCLVVGIVRTGFEYANAVATDLKLAIAEPSWFEAYRSARLLQRLIQGHVGGIAQVLSRRLADEQIQAPPEFESWVADTTRLLNISSALIESVHDREQGASDEQLRRLVGLLGQSAYEAVDVVLRIEAMTGDLSIELGNAIRRLGTEGS